METDKYIEVADEHFCRSGGKGELQIKNRYDNGKPSLLRYIR